MVKQTLTSLRPRRRRPPLRAGSRRAGRLQRDLERPARERVRQLRSLGELHHRGGGRPRPLPPVGQRGAHLRIGPGGSGRQRHHRRAPGSRQRRRLRASRGPAPAPAPGRYRCSAAPAVGPPSAAPAPRSAEAAEARRKARLGSTVCVAGHGRRPTSPFDKLSIAWDGSVMTTGQPRDRSRSAKLNAFVPARVGPVGAGAQRAAARAGPSGVRKAAERDRRERDSRGAGRRHARQG